MGEHTTDAPVSWTAVHGREAYRRVLEGLTGIPATAGNRVTVLRNGDEVFPAMLGAIEAAERSIDLMTYIFRTGDIARRVVAALAARARAGVRVRVVLDAFGSRPMEDRLVAELRTAGAEVDWFRPLSRWKVWTWNLRTHRRVLVCDDAVAFTGGIGIAREWEGDAGSPQQWRDTHFKIEGPAVDGVHAAFYSDWLEGEHPIITEVDRFPAHQPVGNATVQVIRAASQPGWNDMAVAVSGLLMLARERVRVTSAYFRPPRPFVELLCAAAARGVDVQVLVPGPHTHPPFQRWAAEHHFEELLERGVRVWVYQPTMHHGKIMTVDGAAALVGTTNFDARSLALNEQIGLVLHDGGLTATLDAHFDEDRAVSVPVDLSAWRQRGQLRRCREMTVHAATFGIRGAGASRRGGLALGRDSRVGRRTRTQGDGS